MNIFIAAAAAPVSQPVTGAGDLDQMEPLGALNHFYRAFNRRDLAMMQANWENSPEAALDNPLGGIRRGWGEIRPVYERIFQSRVRVQVEFHDYTLHSAGDAFWAVGRERGCLALADGGRLDLAIRTSRLYRRDATGQWRQVHHHGSIDDPALLQAYQQAVR